MNGAAEAISSIQIESRGQLFGDISLISRRDSLLLITGLALGDVAMALARLERDGWIIENGGWFEVVDEWADLT